MDIRTEMESLPTADGLMPVYVCRPAGTGPHPAIIVVMEAFGLNGHIKDVSERIARQAGSCGFSAASSCSASRSAAGRTASSASGGETSK